jgi:hypothetical protein
MGGAQALVLVYSLAEPESWRALPAYIAHAQQLDLDPSALPVVVAANKRDAELQPGDDHIRAEARAWAQRQGFTHVEVSARTGPAAELLALFKLVQQKPSIAG